MTFKPGWKGGPGRPKKQTERDYLSATVASVPLARWRKVVKRALADAEAGDAKARDWLSRVLVGDNPAQLVQLVEELQAELWRLRSEQARVETNGRCPAAPGPNGRPFPVG
jgi:hypothetical protein